MKSLNGGFIFMDKELSASFHFADFLLGGFTKPRHCFAAAVFFTLISLHKQACDAASNEKAPTISCRGFVARMGIEPITSGL